MVEAVSIARDGDFDLANQYDDPHLVSAIYGPTSLEPHAFHFPGGHGLQSVHAPGLPLLLAPVAAVTTNHRWMRYELVVIAAIAAMLLMVLLERVPFGRAWERWAAWAAIVLSAPFLVYSGALYPEVPGAAATLGAAVLLSRPRPGPGSLAGASALAGALAWLHVRFLPVSIAIVVIALWRAWPAPRRTAAVSAALAPAVLLGAALAGAFQHWYGSWLPTAQYQLSDSPRTLPGVYRAFVGNMLGTDFGWLPVAPLHVLALVAIGVAVVRLRVPVLLGAAAAALYVAEISLSGVGFPGASFPGRELVIVLPLVAVPLLVGLATLGRWWRIACAAVAVVSLLLTTRAVLDDGTWRPATPGSPLARYEAIWPQPTASGGAAPVSWTGSRGGRTTQAGVVIQGTTPVFPPSSYSAVVALRAAQPTHGLVATITVRDATGRVLATRPVPGDALPPDIGWRAFSLPFHTPDDARMTITVRATGAVGLAAQAPTIANQPGSTAAGVTGYPDVGLAITWVAGMALAGGALVVTTRRRRTVAAS